MRLKGGRTGKRALTCTSLALDGLTRPFDLEVLYGERVGLLGANGTGKSHFLRLLADGGTKEDAGNSAAGDRAQGVRHFGRAALGARVITGHFAQTHHHPELAGRTLTEILRAAFDLSDQAAIASLGRYELSGGRSQAFETLSGGQQARLQILMLELSGATMLLLDEPTDNLDVESAEALEAGLESFAGTVLAATHDRYFARVFERFVLFRADGNVVESDSPVWSEPGAGPLRARQGDGVVMGPAAAAARASPRGSRR